MVLFYETNDNSLMHYGVLGMKWGRRKYQNKDGSLTRAGKRQKAKIQRERDIGDKTSSLYAKYIREYDKSKESKLRDKNPDIRIKELYDQVGGKKYLKDPHGKKAKEIKSTIDALESNPKHQAIASAVVSSIYLSPIAGIAASKISKKTITSGKKRTAIVLGSIVGTTVGMGIYGYAQTAIEREKAIRSEDIKSVRERMRDM